MRDVRRSPRRSRRLATCLALLVVACSKAPTSPTPRTTAASPAAAAAPAASDWRYNRPPAGAPGKLLYPEPEQALLSNGLDVYVVRRPAGVVSMALVARTEPLPARRSGLHAVTVRMLTEGTLEHPGLALAEAVESLGSTLDSDAGRDAVSVSLEILRSDAPRALSLLAEVVQRPALDQAVFKRVQKEWLDGLRAERQNPSRLAALVGLRRLLGPVYGAPVRGTAEDVRSFEISDVRADHRQVFVPNRSALIVVGDVTLGELRADVERLFGSWQATPPPELPTIALPKPPQKPRIVVVDRPGAVQTALFAAQLFPKRSDPGYVARQLLNSILGGLFTSRLNRNLREEHAYTYGAGSAAERAVTQAWNAVGVS